MLGGEDQDLVDTARGGLGEDRAAVGHDEGLVALEGGVEVRHDPDEPTPGRSVGLEGGRGVLLVAGAERAGAAERVGRLRGAGHERVGPLGAARAHDDPTARQRIEAQLVHRSALSGACRPVCLRSRAHGFPSTSTVQVPLGPAAPPPRFCHLASACIGEHGGHASPAGRRRVRRRAAAPRRLRRRRARHDASLLPPPPPGSAASSSRRAPLPEALRRYFRPGVNWAGRTDLRHPGVRLCPPRHEPGCLRPGRRVGAGRRRSLRRRGAAWRRACCGRPSGACRRRWPLPRRPARSRGARGRAGPVGAPSDPGADLAALSGDAVVMARAADVALVLLLAGVVLMIAQP